MKVGVRLLPSVSVASSVCVFWGGVLQACWGDPRFNLFLWVACLGGLPGASCVRLWIVSGVG